MSNTDGDRERLERLLAAADRVAAQPGHCCTQGQAHRLLKDFGQLTPDQNLALGTKHLGQSRQCFSNTMRRFIENQGQIRRRPRFPVGEHA